MSKNLLTFDLNPFHFQNINTALSWEEVWRIRMAMCYTGYMYMTGRVMKVNQSARSLPNRCNTLTFHENRRHSRASSLLLRIMSWFKERNEKDLSISNLISD